MKKSDQMLSQINSGGKEVTYNQLKEQVAREKQEERFDLVTKPLFWLLKQVSKLRLK